MNCCLSANTIARIISEEGNLPAILRCPSLVILEFVEV
jgi:hypothetical protein